MNRIVHISLKVADVKRTGDFYRDVFGFQDAETKQTRDHVSQPGNQPYDSIDSEAKLRSRDSKRLVQ